MSEVPTNVSEITPEWLSTALSDPQTKVVVKSITAKGGIKTGDNFTSELLMVDVDLTYNDTPDTPSFAIKPSPENDEMKFLLSKTRAFYKEIEIYSKVIPDLVNMQYPRPRPIHPKVPRYYYGKIEDGNAIIVMENMMKKGFKMHSKQVVMDENHIKLVMTELAKFHALAHIRIKTSDHSKNYPHVSFIWDDETIFKLFVGGVVAGLETMRAVPGNEETVDKLIDAVRSPSLYQNMMALRKDTSHPMLTITHGDTWNNNLLFRYNDAEEPIDVCFVDWQLACISRPTVDLVYFLFASTSAQFRQEKLREMLQHYYDEFFRTLSSFKGPFVSPDDYPFEKLYEEFMESAIFGVMISVVVIPLTLSKTIGRFKSIQEIEEGMAAAGSKESDETQKLIGERLNDLLKDPLVGDLIVNFKSD